MLFDLFHAVWLCENLVVFLDAAISLMDFYPALALKIYSEILPEQYYQ